MQQMRNYGDDRQTSWCVYCGSKTDTRDHVPSKVLLDEPYPPNLPVVPACNKCNNSFSQDEEYLACLVECTLRGSVSDSHIRRPKVRRILKERPALKARLEQAYRIESDATGFNIESARVTNIVLKLARGHAAFDLNEVHFEPPNQIFTEPLHTMSLNARRRFEQPIHSPLFPEVGSRAMQRLVLSSTNLYDWIVVQPGLYRYLTAAGQGAIVRVVIGEYLGCEVQWI